MTGHRPLVSIIIPCYRQARFLSAAIGSALGQSYPSIECVVVNDGSDDNTDSVATSFGAWIQYVVQPNGGLSSARNAGIRHATGEYFLFLDADDLLHPEAISWLLQGVHGTDNQIAVMGYRRFVEDPYTEQGEELLPPQALEVYPAALLRGNAAAVHCHLAPARLVREVGGFAEALRAHEDWDLWLRLAVAGAPFVTVPRVGAFYRCSPASMSADRNRMEQTHIEVVLHAHHAILHTPGALTTFGDELFLKEWLLRRFLAANGSATRSLPAIHRCLRELRGLGIGPKPRPFRRFCDWLFGHRAEIIAVYLLRLFRRGEYAAKGVR